MQDAYKNIEEYNLGKKCKELTVFDDMITDMINYKKFNPIVTELFVRGRKLNIFVAQSYFEVSKDVRLNSMHYFIIKIPNKRELQQIEINYPSDIYFKDFMKIYKICIREIYSFLVNDAPLRFGKNLLDSL